MESEHGSKDEAGSGGSGERRRRRHGRSCSHRGGSSTARVCTGPWPACTHLRPSSGAEQLPASVCAALALLRGGDLVADG